MPVKWKYVPDNKSFGKFMMSEEPRHAANQVAQAIVDDLKVTVTRSSRVDKDGHLADSYKVDEHAEPVSIDGNPRVGSAVYTDHPAGPPEEFGGRGRAGNTAKRWLGKAGAKFHVGKRKPK